MPFWGKKQDREPQREPTEPARGVMDINASAQDIQEELAFLRQQFNSLSIRGHYTECVKSIEDNIRLFYEKERWPENFFSILRLHQRCYPSIHKEQPYEEYLSALLKKNGIPFVFAKLLRGSDSSIVWSAEYFRDLAMISQGQEDYETALSYSDIVIKIDPGSANAYLVKGWILDDLGKGDDAVALYRQSLELNATNRHALGSLAKHYIAADPKRALEYIDKAIDIKPGDASNLGLRASILHKMGDRNGALAALDEAMTIDPYNADYPFQKAELYMEEGRRVSAIPQYRIAAALNDKHVPSLMRLADLSQDAQPDLALTYANTVITLEPKNRGASLLRGQLLQRLGENEAAIRQYRSLLELDAQCHEAMGGLGALYLADGKPERALPLLEQALSIAPNTVAYHLHKARAHQKLDDIPNAIKEYKATLSLDDTIARAWAELGYLHTNAKPKEALEYFSKAISISPENAYYYTAKAELLTVLSSDKAAAIECYNLACTYDPGNADLHEKLGRLLEQEDNIASAAEHYKTAISLRPENAETYYRLARLLLETHPEMALLYINSAIGLSATTGEYYYFKGRILTYLGRNAEAMAELRQSLAENSQNTAAMSELADLLSGGSPRVALMYLNRAIELSPDSPAYLCSRAHLLYQMGQKGKALDQYEKLLKKSPDQHEALFGMARILADKKDEKALEYFDRAIAGAPAEAEYHAEKAAFLARDSAAFLARDSAAFDDAVAEFTTAISLNNQAWEVILGKARLLDAHGDSAAAMDEYRRVLLLYPKCTEATARMGVMLADLSPAAALVYLDHAVSLDPENYLHFAWRGKVLANLGRDDAASEEYRAAISLGGDNAETYFTLADILSRRIPEVAMKYCLLALEQDGNKAPYQLLCGDLHCLLGERDNAKVCYARAAALDSKSHDALEKLANLAFLEESDDCKERVESALAQKPDCPVCVFLKARILDERDGDTASALEYVTLAVKLSPENVEYRERLVALLQKKRSYLRLTLERSKLSKLRRKLDLPIPIPEPPDFAAGEALEQQLLEPVGLAATVNAAVPAPGPDAAED